VPPGREARAKLEECERDGCWKGAIRNAILLGEPQRGVIAQRLSA
jgi:hypothetical protein